MLRFLRVLVITVLVLSLFIPSCSPQDNAQEDQHVNVVDPFDDLVDRLQLTEDQAEQLRSGTGTLELTATQVALISEDVEQALEDSELEDWLGESRWEEMCDVYGTILTDYQVDLQRVADLASDVYHNLQEEPDVEVFTSLQRLSEEEAYLAERQGNVLSTSSNAIVYTPRGTDEGDSDFHNKPWTYEWKRGWAWSIGVASSQSGAVGVHSDAGLIIGSSAGYAGQRILIHVPQNNTDVRIDATIEYATATTHTFMDVSGTFFFKHDSHSKKITRQTIESLLSWDNAAEKLLAVIPDVQATALGMALLAMSLEDFRDVTDMWGSCHDYHLLREALEDGGADKQVVTHSIDSLDAGYYWFTVGLRARAASVLLGASGAVAIGQVTEIKVTQDFEEESGVPSLGEAVDNTELTWTTTGDADWFNQTTVFYYDEDAAQSGSITHDQSTSLHTKVTGPGTLTFYWKVSSESTYYNKDYLRFYINGEQKAAISGSVDWQQQTYYINYGTHDLEWRYTKDSSGSAGQDCGWVDWVQFTPWEVVPLGQALDNTELTWTTFPGDANWFGQTTVSYYGGDAAQSGSITHGQGTSLYTTVTGPGTLTFYWKVSSQSTYYNKDYLRFYINGEQKAAISGSVDWQQQTYYINYGTHDIEWRYTKDSSGSAGHDRGWVDWVQFTPWEVVPLGEALDNTELTWTTNPGDANWFGQTTVSYYGGDAAQSGSITHGQGTSLYTAVTGPGTLTFYWKVSSQSTYYNKDYLRFYINGEQKAAISGSVDWQQQTYNIDDGVYTLEWKYTKDSSGSLGHDRGWVDKVEFTPSG